MRLPGMNFHGLASHALRVSSSHTTADSFSALVLSSVLLSPASAVATYHPGNAVKGKQTFRFCAFCHSLNPAENRVGPSLAGLFGRRASSVKGFRHTKALKESVVVWDELTLNAWFANPWKFIPGNRMRFRGLKSPEVRANVIVFLKQATRQVD